MTDIAKSIKAINPEAKFTINAEDINQITWLNDTPIISDEDILVKQAELRAEHDNKSYARARDRAYPKVKEFMEAYTEKEIGEDSTKWDAYVVKYNKVRSDNQKP